MANGSTIENWFKGHANKVLPLVAALTLGGSAAIGGRGENTNKPVEADPNPVGAPALVTPESMPTQGNMEPQKTPSEINLNITGIAEEPPKGGNEPHSSELAFHMFMNPLHPTGEQDPYAPPAEVGVDKNGKPIWVSPDLLEHPELTGVIFTRIGTTPDGKPIFEMRGYGNPNSQPIQNLPNEYRALLADAEARQTAQAQTNGVETPEESATPEPELPPREGFIEVNDVGFGESLPDGTRMVRFYMKDPNTENAESHLSVVEVVPNGVVYPDGTVIPPEVVLGFRMQPPYIQFEGELTFTTGEEQVVLKVDKVTVDVAK